MLERRIHEWNKLADERAEAAAQLEYLREFRKSLLAILASQAPDGSEAARDRWARQHADYLNHLKAQSEAVREFEKLNHRLRNAHRRSEIWQSMQANKRAEREQYRG